MNLSLDVEWTNLGLARNRRPTAATAGPILVQGFLQYFCQGVIISQGVKFYHRWHDDPIVLRVYVAALVFFSLATNYPRELQDLDRYGWGKALVYLIWRCYKISRRNLAVLAFHCSLLAATTVASVILTIRIAKVIGYTTDDDHADPLHTSQYAYPLWVYATLAMALSLTIILSVSLWRSRTGLRHLDRTLKQIIFVTFECAALPTACMLASAIFYSTHDAHFTSSSDPPSPPLNHPGPYPHLPPPTSTVENATGQPHHVPQKIHLDFFFVILTGKVYTLGLLRTLNSRRRFRAALHASDLGRRSLTTWNCGEAHAADTPRGSLATSPHSVDRRGPRAPADNLEGVSDNDVRQPCTDEGFVELNTEVALGIVDEGGEYALWRPWYSRFRRHTLP